ncbi:MAG: DUF6020 family protein [Lachnospiraceae bacterium]|nr:DUF6020 family protein [Lachnospiraceae bacterium]
MVVDECELTEEESDFIEHMMPLEEIRSHYLPGISDPIKGNANQEYLADNALSFVKIWIGLGLRYPGEYIVAYSDQTKGFWNGGYNYSTVGEYIADYGTELGLYKISMLSSKSIAYLLTNLFRFIPLLDILISIGIYIWIVLYAFIRSIDRCVLKWTFIILPYMLLIISLWLTTPVYT